MAGVSSVLSITHRGSSVDELWEVYLTRALTLLPKVLPETWLQAIERDSRLLGNATMAIIEFLPQATFALLSGMLAWGILSALRFTASAARVINPAAA